MADRSGLLVQGERADLSETTGRSISKFVLTRRRRIRPAHAANVPWARLSFPPSGAGDIRRFRRDWCQQGIALRVRASQAWRRIREARHFLRRSSLPTARVLPGRRSLILSGWTMRTSVRHSPGVRSRRRRPGGKGSRPSTPAAWPERSPRRPGPVGWRCRSSCGGGLRVSAGSSSRRTSTAADDASAAVPLRARPARPQR